MGKRPRGIEILRQMNPGAIRRLALAVFLMFGVLGPLTILMESQMHLLSWRFIFIQTVASGGIGAGIILAMRKRWWVMALVIMFWTSVMFLNSGGLSFQFDDQGRFRVVLGGVDKVRDAEHETKPLTIESASLDAIYVQRGVVGLIAIALLSAGYVVFLRVIRGEVQQRERLESEVRIARDIQQSLLPSSTLSTPNCTASGITLPATEVGGDYYDAIHLPDGKIALAIADVAGHGVGAGILSAMTKSAFHSQLLHDPTAAGVLANLNATIFALTDEKMFVTFGYVLIDPAGRTGEVATAGHPPVLVRRAASGAVEQYRSHTLGLGIRESTPYTSDTVRFNAGDLFLLYTDGVTEAMNAKGEQFGLERLTGIFSSAPHAPEEICKSITRTLASFTGDVAREDDVSLLCAAIR